ncbi:MAG TPA: NapC/NirT family cytochrome c [Fimbriimonadaceae bacterium]|nr:NapC/NirT family cytochrome c [Fimbriimonadaceae bacterium]
MRKKLPAVFYNTTSMIGMTIAFLSLAMIAFLFILTAFAGSSNPYMGLITFIALPGMMLFGLLVALVGLRRAVKRARRGIESKLPVLDFNDSRQRYAFTTILLGGVFLMSISGFGTYQAYEYTESVEFCGKVCHNVMKPEYTAYQNSPHARVPCVQCHIGNGAEWWVRSKISGSYQVYSVLFHKYHRPIETPIHNLRPAKETCEQCHWPKHFYAQKLSDHQYYLSDDKNTPFQLSMLMKIGGAEQGTTEGIHAHMYLDNQVTYISLDRQRQIIPYVEMRDKTGKVTVYRSTEIKATDQDLRNGEHRLVDCIDCHNRPSHRYNHPEVSVNLAMSRGVIDPAIPEIKLKAVEELEKPYKTEGEALQTIHDDLEKYYKENHAPEYSSMRAQFEKAIQSIQQIYSTNYFPEMNVSWKEFPNNTDHLHSSGCFRCHDDKHVSADGRVISKNCQTCHTILSIQPPGGKRITNINGVPFQHPVDIGDEWKTTPCKECHGKQKEE